VNIGIPKERRPFEFRAGLSPVGVRLLTEAGHTCYVERGAGVGAGFSDEEYVRAGARIAYTPEEAWGRVQLVLKVTRPLAAELEWAVPDQVLMGYLYLSAAHPGKVAVLVEKKITAIAYERIQLPDGSHPVLKPLSQIGGTTTGGTASCSGASQVSPPLRSSSSARAWRASTLPVLSSASART